ncbi:hypothetical protein ROS62_06030 [Streptomyces sp. DSM 41972]|uniref:Integral membrane protein n=1 Tax=Streptomyces althioticus subsp. attaecolombicae TaxID=3075534 RepID=A0ABU3HUV2_9ACTN|nr:hypothetical protein [Streptomyces sp. DSM 41972]SCD49373.1 hypothetical protein GA0115245_10734 [Streptomyces sp. di188]SCD53217.1 hypothetical protein GA0115238_11384 [Streptomyces sp. di50b]
MDLEKSGERQAGEGCLVVALRMPVRIVALVLVVPVRMVWDALVVVGRFLHDRVLRPVGRALAWVGRAVFVWPFVALWRWVLVPLGVALRWLGTVLVVVPAGWLYRRALTPVGHALAWCGRGLYALASLVVAGIATALYRTARVLLVWPAYAAWRWVLAPVGRVLAVVAREVGAALGHAWRVAGYVSLAVGRAVAAFFRWTVVEPARWVHRTVLTPVGHAVRDAVLRPVAQVAHGVERVTRDTLRDIRVTTRQVRQDVRRALLGDPKTPGEQGNREIVGSVGSSDGRDGRILLTKR